MRALGMGERLNIILWLALQKIFYYEPRIAHELLQLCGSPEEIFREAKSTYFSKVMPKLHHFNEWKNCEKDLNKYENEKISIITYGDARYPNLLKEIYDPPVVLIVKGNVDCLNQPGIAVVGARKASAHGREVAFEIACELACKGVVVVSGMAFGIDAAAHKGALGSGATIAVWGSGIDCCYPRSHLDLSKRIEDSGCIVSEFPWGMEPYASHFPQRNRIISGLSWGVVIVEAAAKSGSLITARFALEQGREVFAVPGSARGHLSSGTHSLLKNGAVLVENGDEIINVLSPQLTPFLKNPRHLSDDVNNEHPLLQFLPVGQVHLLDSIIEKSGLPCGEVLKEITTLTLKGIIEELPGKRFKRRVR